MMRFLVFFVTVFLMSAPVKAHPHAWIDMETAVIVNGKGEVTGLRIGWLFDDFYSAFTMDGISVTQEALNALAETNLKNLSEYDYFTRVLVDGEKVSVKPVTQYQTEVIENRLWMEFVVELTASVNPMKSNVTYSVFDPTYYVEILHAKEGDPIRIEGGENLGCAYNVTPPEPPEEIYLLASSLDKTQTAGNSIGTYFAEKVSLQCR